MFQTAGNSSFLVSFLRIGYLLYLLPFILIATSYTLYLLFQTGRFVFLRRILVVVLFAVLLIGNFDSIRQIDTYQGPVPGLEKIIDTLVVTYPNQKFTVYDYKAGYSAQDQAISALLFKRHLISPNGVPIGFLCDIKCPVYKRISFYGELYLADLSSNKDIAKNHALWVNVNPANMYDDLIGWSKKHALTSSFSLQGYLTDKLHF